MSPRHVNKPKKRFRPLSFILSAAITGAALMLLISYLSVYISPSRSSVLLFFGLYYVPIFLLNGLLLIITLIKRSRRAWVTFIAMIPSIFYAELFFRIGGAPKAPEGIAVKVITYNTGQFAQQKKTGRMETFYQIAGFINHQKASVVCLQEFYIKDTLLIKKVFKEYPHYYYHFFKYRSGNRFGNITLSRFPIIGKGSIRFKGSTNLCIFTDIDHFGKKLRIYNAHLESHSISFTSIMKKLRNREKMSEEILEVHDRVATTFKRREGQVDTLLMHKQNSPFPSVICGDFNDTPMSYTYHSISKGKKDSFKEAGRGFSATYSFMWPMLRIDYILFPKDSWALSHHTERVPYSDHYPVIARFIIP